VIKLVSAAIGWCQDELRTGGHGGPPLPCKKRDEVGLVPYSTTAQPARYSYRSASEGSSREARMAGTRPLSTPTRTSTPLETAMVAKDRCR